MLTDSQQAFAIFFREIRELLFTGAFQSRIL